MNNNIHGKQEFVTVYRGHMEIWESRAEALGFFLEKGKAGPAEQRRCSTVIDKIRLGMVLCTDDT